MLKKRTAFFCIYAGAIIPGGIIAECTISDGWTAEYIEQPATRSGRIFKRNTGFARIAIANREPVNDRVRGIAEGRNNVVDVICMIAGGADVPAQDGFIRLPVALVAGGFRTREAA